VRSEALFALESIPELDSRTIGALIREVKTNVYSTAYVAARILGKQRSDLAVPALIGSLDEPDYMLQSTSMVALARLGARQTIPKIEEVIRSTENPRVRISGAYALELFGAIESIPTLISCLKAEDRPANVSDELVLTISGILGIDKEFYLLYSEFIEDNRSGIAQLTAHAHDLPLGKERINAWTAAVNALFAPTPDTTPLARLMLSSSKISSSLLILSDALLDPKLDYPGFNYLCAYVAIHLEHLKDY
jgi:FOG: HEAT repeat